MCLHPQHVPGHGKNPELRLIIGIDKTFFGIDTVYNDCLIDSLSLSPSHPCAHGSMPLSCACRFMCGYLNTGNPEHDIDNSVPSQTYLDQDFNTHYTRLPQHRHIGLSPHVSTLLLSL
jgi:hypothetical protein